MSKRKTRGAVALCALTLALAPLGAAHADAAKDVQVAGRALTFLENGPTGKAVLGVVFDPSKPASVAEKNAASAVSGVSGVAALYVTTGVNVGAAAKAKKLITIGSDVSCATSGACVMSVSADPKVEIVVNRAAAAAVGAVFKAAFRMMIREV
ncbi:hypothetical protein ASD38_00095 [Caulobacter sp. Root487D2Y]|uniref:hypothetical protein n=1 Tax=Caulobacter sp. Root487D2Y TaxID=1736547 RepID=UPI0006F2F092|nr:hypothetical protein [Caulobacter sp. Root487D2Y]KQY35015.1 hypothetical protein ASD38_00095 [Caulobacter sp. Root487D2Y]